MIEGWTIILRRYVEIGLLFHNHVAFIALIDGLAYEENQ